MKATINKFVTIVLVGVVLSLFVGVSGATWCDTDFAKRVNVSVNNTGGAALTDYQVYVNLSANPTNETSLRVYNATSCTLRPHWTENETGGNSYDVWINYSVIAASAWTNNTAIYYDNVAVSSASNGTNTFEFFDDFPTDTISSSLETIVSNLGTKMATMDSQMTHKVARDSSGYIYFTYRDSNYYSYIAKSQYPNSLEGTWTTQKLFGGAGALLGNLLIAKFGSSIVIDTSTDELSFVQVEKTNHYCIYSRCNLTGTGGITNASNWYKEGAPNPTTQGYQQIGSIGAAATTQLSMVTHDGDGKAMVAYGETTGGTYYVKYAWYNTSWPTPITLSSYSDYEWAIDLIWTANDKCHIAWESYETDTVKYKKCVGVANSMTASNWKKADESTAGYDNAIFHSTHKCRGFSMVSDSNYNLYFVGQTTHATENMLLIYNVLTDSTKTWKFTSGSCGLVSDGGGNNVYQYNQLGCMNNNTPIDVYVKELGDNKAYYRTYNGTDWSDETEIISGTAAATYPIIERQQPAGQTTMPVFWTKYVSQYDIVGTPLPSSGISGIGDWTEISESGDILEVVNGYLKLTKGGTDGDCQLQQSFPAQTKCVIEAKIKQENNSGDSALLYVHEGSTNAIYSRVDLVNDIIKMYYSSAYQTVCSATSQWYKFSIIADATTDTCDFYAYNENGSLCGSKIGVPLRNPVSEFNKIGLGAYASPDVALFDDVRVRKYASPEPSTTLGSEEQQSATPPSISNIVNGSISSTSQWIDWDVNQTAHNRVKWSNESDLTPTYWSSWQNSTNAPNMTLSGLAASTQYWYQAWSYNTTNTSLSDNSSTLSFTTASVDTSFTVTLPSGYTYLKFEPSNSTAQNVTPNGQTDSQEFYNVTNTGDVNLDIRLKLNETVLNIELKADTDNNPVGAKEVNTTLVTIYSNLATSNSADIWLWSDFSHAVEQDTNKTINVNVTQSA